MADFVGRHAADQPRDHGRRRIPALVAVRLARGSLDRPRGPPPPHDPSLGAGRPKKRTISFNSSGCLERSAGIGAHSVAGRNFAARLRDCELVPHLASAHAPRMLIHAPTAFLTRRFDDPERGAGACSVRLLFGRAEAARRGTRGARCFSRLSPTSTMDTSNRQPSARRALSIASILCREAGPAGDAPRSRPYRADDPTRSCPRPGEHGAMKGDFGRIGRMQG